MTKILAALALLLAGCTLEVPPRALLQGPSGQIVDCTAMSEVNTPAASFPNYGSAGRAMGAGMADGLTSAFRERDCMNSYMAVGFQPLVPVQAYTGPPAYVKPSTCPENYTWNGNGCSEMAAIDVRSPTCGTSKGCGPVKP